MWAGRVRRAVCSAPARRGCRAVLRLVRSPSGHLGQARARCHGRRSQSVSMAHAAPCATRARLRAPAAVAVRPSCRPPGTTWRWLTPGFSKLRKHYYMPRASQAQQLSLHRRLGRRLYHVHSCELTFTSQLATRAQRGSESKWTLGRHACRRRNRGDRLPRPATASPSRPSSSEADSELRACELERSSVLL